MKHVVKTLPVALALAMGAGHVWALGLGPIEVKSQLSEPFVAEIPLIGAGPGELEALNVRLAAPDAFDRVGLPRPAGVTANLQFSVGRNARGEAVIRVTTPNRVDDPFVAFLLEADWGKGSVVREFTALIDPPFIAAATVTPMSAPTVAASVPMPAPVAAPPAAQEPAPIAQTLPAPSEPLPQAEPLPQPAEPAPLAAQQPAPPAAAPVPEPTPAPVAEPLPPEPIAEVAPEPQPDPAPLPPEPPPLPLPPPAVPVASPPRDTDGRLVEGGDTLWQIASANTQGASVAQMMLAIQRANPDAFIRDNINLLRKGAVLRIPTGDQAQVLANNEANAQVREQMNAWRASTAAATQPVLAPDEAPRLAAPAPATPARTSATAATSTRPAATGGRLEIAPPAGAGATDAQSGAASGGSGSELRAELQQAREDVSARDAELRELRSRLTEQEALANEQKRLIELKDSQLSGLEESLRQNREAAAIAQSAAAEPPVSSSTEAPALAESVVSPPPASTPETASTAAAEPSAETSPTDATPSAPQDASEPWYTSIAVLGGGGVVLVGGLLALLLRRRKASAVAMPVAAAPSRSRLSDDSDFLSNLSPNAAEDGAESLHESDGKGTYDAPPALRDEAVTAERPVAGSLTTELERNVVASPADLDQHVTLLRQLYNAGNVDAFIAAATTMRANVAENADPRWREVVVMGMGLVPGHALFREVLWNPVKSDDVRTRKDASAPTPALAASPEATPMPEPEPLMGSAGALDDTRLELAKAYIEIGDTDGARGMLEEVLAEGNAAARAEAERLLKQIG